jgi:DNA-binding phage protein
MALTRSFKETVQARAQRDPSFRREMLREAIDCLLLRDVETGKTILRDYINATIGFSQLSRAVQIPSKSIMRMLGRTGNPHAQNIFDIVSVLQRHEGIRLQVRSSRAS